MTRCDATTTGREKYRNVRCGRAHLADCNVYTAHLYTYTYRYDTDTPRIGISWPILIRIRIRIRRRTVSTVRYLTASTESFLSPFYFGFRCWYKVYLSGLRVDICYVYSYSYTVHRTPCTRLSTIASYRYANRRFREIESFISRTVYRKSKYLSNRGLRRDAMLSQIFLFSASLSSSQPPFRSHIRDFYTYFFHRSKTFATLSRTYVRKGKKL